MRWLLLVAFAACSGGGRGAKSKPEVLAPSSPGLPPPTPIDPNVKGAAYLSALADQIQPRWAQFLEDCRLRLIAGHPLNDASLTLFVTLVIDRSGKLDWNNIKGSGNREFDAAALEVLEEVRPVAPPLELQSDDEKTYVQWLFARDRRQAGPATARVDIRLLPLRTVIGRWTTNGEIARAAHRVLNGASDTRGARERQLATRFIMMAALREGLSSSDGDTRLAALDAVAHTRAIPPEPFLAVTVDPQNTAPDVEQLFGVNIPIRADVHGLCKTGETRQRLAAVETAAVIGDKTTPPVLLENIETDLVERPEIALAKIRALRALLQATEAKKIVETAVDMALRKKTVAIKTAVSALAIVPDSKLAPEIAKWFEKGTPELRQTICAALPDAAANKTTSLLARGLRDADATVRATCATAAARLGKRVDKATIQRLVELARDRDELARAHATGALGMLAPAQRPKTSVEDRSPRVRVAAAVGASEAELRVLVKDKDPDVRAAALATLADRAGEKAAEIATAAVGDEASQVRRAAIAGITDAAVLEKLAGDPDPEVATAALVRYAAKRGQAASTNELLKRLIAATPKSLERVRIARAWLLAP